jgi:type IV secretion system protein VirB11
MMTDEVRSRLIEKMSREAGSDILGFLADGDVTEIMLNDDGRVWICRRNQSSAVDSGVTMPFSRSISFLGTVASFYDKTLNTANTTLSEVLPIDGSRLSGVIPPTVEAPSFNIRKRAPRVFTLADYIQREQMTPGDREVIRDGILKRKNFLIAGATGSGKTTLANAVLEELNELRPMDRIVSIEDTAELQIEQANKVRMYTNENVSMQKLLFTAMRQNPERIIIGEIRDKVALDLLKSWNTGHPGGVTTLHANSSLEALFRLEMLILEATPGPMRNLIGQALGIILFIERLKGVPTLTQILEVRGYDRQKEDYVTRWIKNISPGAQA